MVFVFTVKSFLAFGRVEVGKMFWIGVQRDPLFVYCFRWVHKFILNTIITIDSYCLILKLLVSNLFICLFSLKQHTEYVTASSSDDESVGGGDQGSTPERERVSNRGVQPLPPQSDTSSTGSARETPPQQRQIHRHTRYELLLFVLRRGGEF